MHRRLALVAAPAGCLATYVSTSTPICEPSQGPGPPSHGAKLKQVQVVFRHGARTPLSEWYWDGIRFETGTDCGQLPQQARIMLHDSSGGPAAVSNHNQQQVNKKLPGGCSMGELTLIGQQQARDLGGWLRQRYVDQLGFLPSDMKEGSVGGRTTQFARTIATLQGVLSGLYPGTSDTTPILTASDKDELLYSNLSTCERLDKVFKEQMAALKAGLADDPAVAALQQRVQTAMQLAPDAKVEFVKLHDALTTLRTHSKQTAAGLAQDPTLLRDVEEEASRRMRAAVAPSPGPHQQDILRLGLGRLVGEISQRMQEALQVSNPQPQLLLYSGHDTTIMPLLVMLGQDTLDWPPYCSNLVFELWEVPGSWLKRPKHLVRVLYNRSVLPISGQDGMPLESFQQKVVQPYALDTRTYKSECALQSADMAPLPQDKTSAGASISGL